MLPPAPAVSFLKYFLPVRDPRRKCGKLHKLEKIIGLSVIAIMGRAETWSEVEQYGEYHQGWISNFLDLENGIPSHDTFGRVFSMLDPKEFQECFVNWVESLRKHVSSEIVSIDGKTLRRSFDKANGTLPFHIVSAWSNENELSLGQQQVDKKSNEITAIPRLLKLLALKGCIVTIDAMGCQKDITKQIRDKKADYVLTLKSNQKNLRDRAENFFNDHSKTNFKDLEHEFHETKDDDHGRKEHRKYYLTTNINFLKPIDGWADIASVGMVVATRTIKGESTSHTRYFISSLKEKSILDFSRAVRCHWGIENKLHWTLDVCMREDMCRIRKNYAAQNFAALRKMALNLIKTDKSSNKSFRSKKFRASCQPEYLIACLINKNINELN